MIIITVVAVVDDDTYYWVTCPPTINFKFITKCDNCYYKVRQLILLQSATAFLLKSATSVITSAIGITKCDRTPSCLR